MDCGSSATPYERDVAMILLPAQAHGGGAGRQADALEVGAGARGSCEKGAREIARGRLAGLRRRSRRGLTSCGRCGLLAHRTQNNGRFWGKQSWRTTGGVTGGLPAFHRGARKFRWIPTAAKKDAEPKIPF